jgi:peptidoglycan/xylan/chitin deacetylase (PgdA/CDA1 family)
VNSPLGPATGAAGGHKTVLVTTSWDDGHRLDPKLAALLDRYGIAGTFYISPRNIEFEPKDRLRSAAVRELSARFEMGGHTLSHQRLPKLTPSAAMDEIRDGKREVEDIIGGPVTSFCYPRGEYESTHVRMVQECGFTLARTVRRHDLWPGDAFETRTTVNAYAHWVDGPAVVRMAGLRPWLATRMFRNWDEFAMAWFDKCLREGGVFHLWGHSWEVDARQDWARLERVLDYISGRTGVRYVTNGALAGVQDLTR